jgi:hypothetical protein
MSYAPSLIVEESIKISKVRELPLLGRSLVQVGDTVKTDSLVLSAELPGELIIVRLAEKLGIEPERIARSLKVKEGSEVKKGELLASNSSFFGWLNDEVRSPVDGKIEYIIQATGHLGIRLASKTIGLNAYISGTVVSEVPGSSITVEAEGTLIQGIFGVGGERTGTILYLDDCREVEIQKNHIDSKDLKGKIICGGVTFSNEAINFAASSGAVGIFTGSITSEALEKYTGTALGISMTGDEELPLSLVISEGFGSLSISERIEKILKSLNGREASFSGATQVRAGAIRPELIITDSKLGAEKVLKKPIFEIGRKVRCLRAPQFGKLGEIIELPHAPHKVGSGAIVRVALVKFDKDQSAYVPRANLEIVA